MDEDAGLIGSLWRAAAARLQGPAPERHAQRSAALEAQWLLARALGEPRSLLLTHAERPVGGRAHTQFEAMVLRRLAGEPLAYILGEREFWSLTLKVTPAVLVPRPETELVVERALALCTRPAAVVADLGTGSGAIALALAHERPAWHVTATDQSADALAVAAANAVSLGLERIRFRRGDWLAALQGERFDLIASNPPYIADDDPALHDPALRCEPQAALRSGTAGLDALGAITAGALAHLHPGGWLVVEHGAAQAGAVARMLVAQGFAHVRCHTDLAGRERVSEAQRPHHPG